MRASARIVPASLAFAACLTGAAWAAPAPDPAPDGIDVLAAGSVVGRVTSASSPLAAAWVYAYQLADYTLSKVATDQAGAFHFTQLPAGLYKIIAFKPGFLPAVVMLSRDTPQARQSLDLELLPASTAGEGAESGFWSLRERIPPDVLRDIESVTLAGDPAPGFSTHLPGVSLRAEMQAMAGIQESLDFGAAQVSSGRVGIDGRYRDLRIGLTGRFAELQTAGGDPVNSTNGSSQWVSVRFENPEGDSRVNVSSHTNRMARTGDGDADPVDFESHTVRWSQRLGPGRSDVTAQYIAETNFHRQGSVVPAEIPVSSRALRFEGSYTAPLSERTTIQAGIRYRDMESEYAPSRRLFSLLPEETVEVYSRGGLRMKPAVIVEYGLYSKLRDGSLSLMPQGGVILKLGDHWQASTLAGHRLDDDQLVELSDFTPAFFGEGEACQMGESYCYQVLLSRSWGQDESLSFGATHREFGETTRLYFNRDFFNRLESLFLVRGDDVPEVQFGLTRRLGPAILARIESNVAVGGGGLMLANNRTYENELRYVVTSMDTRFEQTSTGVFLAFHRLEQAFTPVGRRAANTAYSEMEFERLQLRLTQSLNRLLSSLAWDWAVHLDMEVSRGGSPDLDPAEANDLHKRLTGGFAVKF